MLRIVHIARYEFLSLFVSPIAWLMLIVFVIQASISYAGKLDIYAAAQFSGMNLSSVTSVVFENGMIGVYADVVRTTLWYVPLLTMGLFAREVSSGSINLLMSSPVSDLEMVLGKYVAILGYFFLFFLFLCGLVLFTSIFVPDFVFASAFLGAFGVLLLMAAYAAIGLFMSSLTRYQVVAAVATLAILAVLSFIGSFGQRIPVVAEVAFWFSSSIRVLSFIEGILVSKDLIYFLAIITLFVGLTYFKISSRRQAHSRLRFQASVAGFVSATVAFGVLTSAPQLTKYVDLTPNQRNSPPGEVPAIVSATDTPIRITAYVNVLDQRADRFFARARRSLEQRFLEDLARYNPELKTDYVFYYGPSDNDHLYERYRGESDADIARSFAYENRLNFDDFLSLEEVSSLVDVAAFNYKPLYHVEFAGKSVSVPTFDDPSYHPGSVQYATALKVIQNGPRRISVAAGAGERSAVLNDAEALVGILTRQRSRTSMVNSGFEIDEVELSAPLAEDTDVLVIADPKRAYTGSELDHLLEFLFEGGNALILVEPERVQFLVEVLDTFGVTVSDALLTQQNKDLSPNIVFAAVDGEAAHAAGIAFSGFGSPEETFSRRGVMRNLQSVALDGVGTIDVDVDRGFDVVPVLVPDSSSTESEGVTVSENAVLGVLLRRTVNGKQQRIAIVADADFMSNGVFDSQSIGARGNDRFVANLFRWFSSGAYPIQTLRGKPADTDLHLSIRQVDQLRILFCWILPIVFGVFASYYLLRRRRR